MVKKSHFERFAKYYDVLTKILMLGTYWSVRRRIVSNPKVDRALDLCSGTGYVTGKLEAENVVALDMSPKMLKINRGKNIDKKNVYIVAGDAFSLPFPDKTFDSVYWTLAAHEFKDVSSIIKEIHRVLKKKGLFVLYDFSRPKSWILRYTYLPFLKHVVELGTFFVYDEKEWESILTNLKFVNIETADLYKASILIRAKK